MYTMYVLFLWAKHNSVGILENPYRCSWLWNSWSSRTWLIKTLMLWYLNLQCIFCLVIFFLQSSFCLWKPKRERGRNVHCRLFDTYPVISAPTSSWTHFSLFPRFLGLWVWALVGAVLGIDCAPSQKPWHWAKCVWGAHCRYLACCWRPRAACLHSCLLAQQMFFWLACPLCVVYRAPLNAFVIAGLVTRQSCSGSGLRRFLLFAIAGSLC